jgi:hypothetical protein
MANHLSLSGHLNSLYPGPIREVNVNAMCTLCFSMLSVTEDI